MSDPIVIYGAGPLARLMHYYFTYDSPHRVAAFTVDSEYVMGGRFCDCPVVPFDRVASEYPPHEVRMFVAVGYRNMRNRSLLFSRAKSAGYGMVNYISSRAITFPDLSIGENNVAMGQVHIEPFATIGDNNLFWSDTLVAHEVAIGNGNYLGAKCVLGGESRIANSCFLGNGVVLINRITIHNETHILPGSIVMQNTKPFYKYMGNPAREIGTHEQTGIVIERG